MIASHCGGLRGQGSPGRLCVEVRFMLKIQCLEGGSHEKIWCRRILRATMWRPWNHSGIACWKGRNWDNVQWMAGKRKRWERKRRWAGTYQAAMWRGVGCFHSHLLKSLTLESDMTHALGKLLCLPADLQREEGRVWRWVEPMGAKIAANSGCCAGRELQSFDSGRIFWGYDVL